jgi:hypothetical protein
MSDLIYLFGGAVLIASILTSISIWAPRKVVVRMTAFIVSAMFVPLSYAGFAALLSKPKPVALEWLRGATQ